MPKDYKIKNEDNAAYLRYTGPQRVDKAMHTLEGIVRGITIDGKTNSRELSALTGWISEHQQYADRHPFNEVLDRLRTILMDGVIDDEERADILWLCDKFSTENAFFTQVCSDMQRLQGIMCGIVADGHISEDELRGLRQWLDNNSHLRSCWPYDELDSLIMSVLDDGVIDANEQQELQAFFKEFVSHGNHRALELRDSNPQMLIRGVCASCPEILFEDRLFCFTGTSERASRQQLAEKVKALGALFSNNLTKKVDYLIVGADGNPCWAFACYGRKVESAVNLRKQGLPILIVHEYDFWDTVEELE